jgi:hypothetical protein
MQKLLGAFAMCRDATVALLMLLGLVAIVAAGALPAMASPVPASASSSAPLSCPSPSESTIEQKAVYPDHIAIDDASLETFRRSKPGAKYGVVPMITYLDGHISLVTGGHADLDDAFRSPLVEFSRKIALTPVIPGCRDTAGNVFLMIFTIPDGRVPLHPIRMAPDPAKAIALAPLRAARTPEEHLL